MKDKFKDIVSKKLNELKDEDQELDKEVEKLLKDSEEGRNKDKLIIIPFLKKLDELINEEYKKHNVPNDYVSRGIKIITNIQRINVEVGRSQAIKGEYRSSPFQYFLYTDEDQSWRLVKFAEETSGKNFDQDKLDEFFDYAKNEVGNLLGEDIKLYKGKR